MNSYARGIFVSVPGYTTPAINTCKEALQQMVITLCELDEIVSLLEEERDLRIYLDKKLMRPLLIKISFVRP